MTLHYSTLHYTTLTLHYSLYDTTVHNTTVHYTTVHCTTLIKPYHNYNCTATTTALHEVHYTTTTPPLHYTTTTTALHHTTSSSCGWRDHCNHCNHCNHSKKNTPTPFGPSVDSLCHPCITTTHLSSSVLSLKLPPPPCAVLLVYIYIYVYTYIYIYYIINYMSHKACTGVYTCSILRQPRCWPSPDTNRTDFAEPRLNHERVAAACSWINLSASASASLQKVHREELPQNCPGMSNLAFYVFLSMLQIEHQL